MDELFKRIEANEIYHPSIPMDVILTDRILEEVVQKYFYKVIRKGGYFTLDDARDIVLSYHFRRNKEERMIYAEQLIPGQEYWARRHIDEIFLK